MNQKQETRISAQLSLSGTWRSLIVISFRENQFGATKERAEDSLQVPGRDRDDS